MHSFNSPKEKFVKLINRNIIATLLLPFLALSANDYINPASFDLRNIDGKSYINNAKNQGSSGSCYAFAATSTAEGSYNYTMDLYDDKRASFSESFIIWSLGQKYEGFPILDNGDGGFSTSDEMQGLLDYGAISDKTFPFNKEILEKYLNDKKELKLNYYWDEPKVKFAGWHRLPDNDIETMKKAMTLFGTLKASVLANDEFADYENGVYSDTYNASKHPLAYESDANHAISLVGWTSDNAWILRNSWGSNWAEDGYMKIDFNSAAVSFGASSLNYLPWNSYGFENVNINNLSDITANVTDTGYQKVSRGIYKWGNDNSSIKNSANITAEALEQDKFSFVHGVYLWAGDNSSIENSGTISSTASSINSQATANGVLLQGTTISNSGSINAQASTNDEKYRATSYGIRHFSFDEDSLIKNTSTGTISSKATSAGAWAYGIDSIDVKQIENHGTITVEGNGSAIGIISNGQRYGNSVVKNFGNINVLSGEDASGIFSFYTNIINENSIVVKSTSDKGSTFGISSNKFETDDSNKFYYSNIYTKIINNGLIDVDSVNSGYGINSKGENFIINTGTINVALSSKGEAFGAHLTNVNEFINTGTISASSPDNHVFGIFSLNSNVFNNGTVNGHASFDKSHLGGVGTFNGDVSMISSTLNPGNSIGTMTINGNYSQDSNSTLKIELDKNSSDELIVNGNIKLEDKTTLEIIPLEYIKSASYTSFIKSFSASGTFNIDSPLVINASLRKDAGDFSLDISRNPYESLGANSTQKSIGNALESLRTNTSSDTQNILNIFDSQKDLSTFQNNLSQLSASLYASASNAVIENTLFLKSTLNQHIQDIRRVDKKDTLAWGTVLASNSSVQKQNEFSQYEQTTKGVILGLDKKVKDNLKIGLAVSLLDQDIDEDDTKNTNKIKSHYAHLYATYDYSNWFASSTLSLGKADISSNRHIPFLYRNATSKHTGNIYALSALGGYEYKINKTSLMPTLELNYTSLKDKSFSENGASDVSLHLDSYKTTSLKSSVGLDLSYVEKKDYKYIKPNIYVKWVHEYLGQNDDIKATFVAGGESFNSQSKSFNTNQTILGAGVDVGFSKNISLNIDAQTILAPKIDTDYNLNAKLRFIF